MSGYNDPEMLRAAVELAQGFGRTKALPKKKVGGGGSTPRQENWEPHQAGQQRRHGQVTAPPRQTLPSFGSFAPPPPPSRRSYGSSVTFSTGRAGRSPVIGSLGVDFLRPPSSKVEPPDNEKTATSSVSVNKQESQIDPPTGHGRNGEATKPDPISTPPRSSGNDQAGNILDAFYSILAKKPSIGQEIETLANILPKAMDLNAPGKATLDTPPVKENAKYNNRQCTCLELNGEGKHGAKHEKTCPRYLVEEKSTRKVDEAHSNDQTKAGDENHGSKNPGVERKPNNSHSRKLSPVAPAFVPKVNEAREQTAGTNQEHQISNKKLTKGLSASMWA